MKGLKRKDDAISHAAVDALCALMQVSAYYVCALIFVELYFWFANFAKVFEAHENKYHVVINYKNKNVNLSFHKTKVP